MGRAHAVHRPVVLYLFMFVILCCTTYKLSKMPSKTTGLGLESFFVGGSRPVAINSTTPRAGKPAKSAIVSVPFGLKVHLSLKIFKLLLAAQLVVLSGDVILNPGPLHSEFVCPPERRDFCNESFSSFDSESDGHVSFASQFNSSMDSLDDSEPHLYFNLDLPSKGLRIGHWNVNQLTSSKFDQIKMFLKNKDGMPQVDVLWLNETFLKPTIPDTLYSVPGFTIFRRDRRIKNGGGVLAFVNDELYAIRRMDLEDSNLEILWLETAPFKSKRSFLLAGIYRPPSSTRADDIALENNVEKADLLNKETILIGDFNIDASKPQIFNKHRLCKSLNNMNFKQLVSTTTRPVSNACLDHIHTNNPQRIENIVCPNIGLSDHLPVFAVRRFNRNYERNHQQKGNIYIKYRYMKNFNVKQFKATLKETPWDSVFIFDDIDDMFSSWELLFNTALDSNCPWRVKRVARARKPPWLNSSVTKQLRERDRLLKIAKRSQNPVDWESYKAARNRAVSLLRRAKSQFFKTTLEHNKNNPRGIWKTIKSLIGVNKQQSIHRLRIDEQNIVNNKEMAEAFNIHFSTIADKLRNLLPDMLFDTAKLNNFVRSRKDKSAIFSIPSVTERDVVGYL